MARTHSRCRPPHSPGRDPPGYRNLCKLLTAAARGPTQGRGARDWEMVAAHAAGLCVLTGGDEGPLARALASPAGTPAPDRRRARRAARAAGRRSSRTGCGSSSSATAGPRRSSATRLLLELAARLRLPLVATNGVRYARRRDKPLHDVLTCIRHRTRLDEAGALLAAQSERH